VSSIERKEIKDRAWAELAIAAADISDQDWVLASAAVVPIWIGAIETRDNQTYDLTVEG
jgi:hypothetical protein